MIAERQQQAQGFRDLDVYRRSFALVPLVYDLCERLPAIERYDLASQLRRAAKSIPTNIGEGYALRGDAPRLFCKHLRIAYGSAVEMQIHFDLALELHYLDADDIGGLPTITKCWPDAVQTLATLAPTSATGSS